jgi:hypothetical protein
VEVRPAGTPAINSPTVRKGGRLVFAPASHQVLSGGRGCRFRGGVDFLIGRVQSGILMNRRDRGVARPDKGGNERCRGGHGGTSGLERRPEWGKAKLGDQGKRNRHGR